MNRIGTNTSNNIMSNNQIHRLHLPRTSQSCRVCNSCLIRTPSETSSDESSESAKVGGDISFGAEHRYNSYFRQWSGPQCYLQGRKQQTMPLCYLQGRKQWSKIV